MTATQPTTGALHDALRDLDRSDLTTDTGRLQALNTLDQLDRWLTDLRDYVTALDASDARCPRCGAKHPWHTADCAAHTPAPVQGEQQ